MAFRRCIAAGYPQPQVSGLMHYNPTIPRLALSCAPLRGGRHPRSAIGCQDPLYGWLPFLSFFPHSTKINHHYHLQKCSIFRAQKWDSVTDPGHQSLLLGAFALCRPSVTCFGDCLRSTFGLPVCRGCRGFGLSLLVVRAPECPGPLPCSPSVSVALTGVPQ